MRFEHGAPKTSTSSDPYVALGHHVRDETPSRPGSVLVQKLCHVEYDEHISALDVFYEKDGRENLCLGEVSVGVGIEEKMPEISREVNQLNWLRIGDISTPLRGKIWKSDQKIVMDEQLVHNVVMDEQLVHKVVMDEELVQNVLMDEELVQNVLMDEKMVKNFVMGAKIDPKVVVALSVFKIGGRNILQPSNRKLSEECINENEPRLSITIPSSDPFFMIQYLEQFFVCDNVNVKESKPICEDVHEMMQCYGQHHFAASNDLQEHVRRHSLWKKIL